MSGVVAALLLLWPSCYRPPVAAPVVDPFRPPPCTYCPGNRGLEYQPGAGSTVVAAFPGRVTFNGVVAGVRYLVVEQVDGRTATYGRLGATSVGVGQPVGAGQSLGVTTERFYFGLRQGDHYVDPAPFIGVARYRPRLLPMDGSTPRPAPPPVLRCAAPP